MAGRSWQARSASLFNPFRRKDLLSTRTALVCGADGCAMATVRRGEGQRRELVSCLSVEANRDEQQRVIAGWLSADRADLGAVSSVLDAADYQLLLVESPDVLPAELRAAVRWRLKDNIDFPVEDAVVDVFDIPEQTRRVGSRMMYTVAAKRQAIESHVALFRSAARRFDVIDIPELALRNLASYLPEAEEGLILLWMNRGAARLLVVKQATLYLTRHVQFAEHDKAGGDEPHANVEAIALELQRSTDYFESHYEQASIDHLIIAPPGPEAERLARALAPETTMRIQTLDLGRAIDLGGSSTANGAAGDAAASADPDSADQAHRVPPDRVPPDRVTPDRVTPTDERSLLAIGGALRGDQKKL